MIIFSNLTFLNLISHLRGTKVDWKPVKSHVSRSILEKFNAKARKAGFVETDSGDIYTILYISESKNKYFKSRSKSYYFKKKGSSSVTRISDHWSYTPNFPKRTKLNVGNIGKSYWTVLKANDKHRFDFRIPGEQYSSSFIGGVTKLSNVGM